ncbi:UNVERIFIED_CONTAM: protein HEAT INTOLERANT 4 [Sesamum radiatum]|uniref:Protein HEAT INTOLERANT 4 n=1 Tax=Sesamum radiatum TaxID=300843 RepID=A0AAW2VSD5_SESRA
MRKRTKRKTTHKAESPSKPDEDQNNGRSEYPSKRDKENHLEEKSRNGEPERSKKAAAQGRPKRAKVSKPESEPEYFPEKRNLEDLWQQVFPVGTEVASPFPPSDKIGIKSVQRETEEIVPMKQMKMDWVPYIPLENRAGLKHLKLERVKKFEYCLPYLLMSSASFWQTSTIRFQEDELEQSTVVQLLFPIDPKPVFCEFDWELDELEEFTDKLIEEEELPADQKEAFKDFVKEKVREAKKANREAMEARKKALAEMSEETKAAFENMRFYKFYPVSTPDTPDVSSVKIKVMRPFLAWSCTAVALHQQILWEGSQGYMSAMPRTSHLRK